MKIFIDSNEAKTTSLGEFYNEPIIDPSGVWLPITIRSQLKSRWCWASITSAIGLYYKASNIGQEELAKILLADFEDNSGRYSVEDIANQNVNFKLDVALDHIKCFSHWTIGKPSFERVEFEINQGRPFGVRIEWFKGGAHYILIKGYNKERLTLFVEDSLHGSSVHSFETFPEKYKDSGAVWTGTYWTKNI